MDDNMVGSVATTTRHPPMDATGDGDDDDQAIEPPSLVSCSICLEAVTDDGSRSTAKLHCGHQFHLDCIGSAFNMKGAMQCPNCRKVEKGQWLYANGSTRSLPEFSLEDWIPDEDFYDLSYSEVPFRVHWCPFGELARVGSSFEEVEPPPTSYHDQRGHHPILAEQEAASMAHSYVAYVGPVPTTTSRSSNNADDTLINYNWNGPSGHNEIFPPHAFPAIQYHSWGRHSPPFSVSGSHMNGADPASVLPATQRSSHGESDAVTMSRSFPHPFIFDHGSGPRRGGSFVSSVVPRHPGSTVVNLERIQASHSFLPQQQLSNSSGLPTPVGPGLRRFDGLMSLPAVVPAPQHDQNGNFFIFPPSSSGQNLQEAESPFYNRFHVWERERLSRFPAVIRDTSWGLFHQTSGASDSGNRPGNFWHRQSS